MTDAEAPLVMHFAMLSWIRQTYMVLMRGMDRIVTYTDLDQEQTPLFVDTVETADWTNDDAS